MANTNNWAAMADALGKEMGKVVVGTAKDAKKNIQARIRSNGQVRTGFMHDSVYTVTSEGSDYKGGALAFSEVAGPENNQEAFVAVAATYAQYPNNGTRYQPANPFFEPGMEDTKPDFEARMEAAAKDLDRIP
jgi:HK97 gp10 family phage protein